MYKNKDKILWPSLVTVKYSLALYDALVESFVAGLNEWVVIDGKLRYVNIYPEFEGCFAYYSFKPISRRPKKNEKKI